MPYSVQYGRICEICGEARDSVDNIAMFLQTQLPFVYVHLITLLVDVNNVLFILKCGVISAVAFMARDWQQLCSEILTCTCVPILYRGLLSISYVIHDPFGEEILDFPIGGYAAYCADCVSDVLKAQERFPGVPDEVYAQTRQSIVRTSQVGLGMQFEGLVGEGPKSAEQIIAQLAAAQAAQLDESMKDYCATPRSDHSQERYMDHAFPQPPVMETHPLPKITNAKDAAAAAAAGRAAEAIGNELHSFADHFAAEMVSLNVGVAVLREAIAKESARRDEDVFRLCGLMFQEDGNGDGIAAALAPTHIDGRRASQVAREAARGEYVEPVDNPRQSYVTEVTIAQEAMRQSQLMQLGISPNVNIGFTDERRGSVQLVGDVGGDLEAADYQRANQMAAELARQRVSEMALARQAENAYASNQRPSQIAFAPEVNVEYADYRRPSQLAGGAGAQVVDNQRTSQVAFARTPSELARAAARGEDVRLPSQVNFDKTYSQVAREVARGDIDELPDQYAFAATPSEMARAAVRGDDVDVDMARSSQLAYQAAEIEAQLAADLAMQEAEDEDKAGPQMTSMKTWQEAELDAGPSMRISGSLPFNPEVRASLTWRPEDEVKYVEALEAEEAETRVSTVAFAPEVRASEVARQIARGDNDELPSGMSFAATPSSVARDLARGDDVEVEDDRRASQVAVDLAHDLVK